MRRKMSVIAAAGLAAAVLAGCQGAAKETTAAASETAAETTTAAASSEEATEAEEETETEAAEELKGSITLYTSQPEEDIQTMIE